MRRIITFIVLIAMTMSSFSAKSSLIRRIDPAFWYAGLKDASLQLMVYGPGIKDASVSVGSTDVRLDSIVRLNSPNYLLVYLSTEGAPAGSVELTFTLGRRRQVVNYELRKREKAGSERVGFSNEDVLYMLMPDRFAQGKGHKAQVAGMNPYKEDRTEPSLRHGGDLAGIREHLNYFTELGITALWFTPVLENNSPDMGKASTYHGYATTDYYRVDPRFGTNEEYRSLIDEAHAKGLKVVMDMIFNHCGFEHPWVSDLPSSDWLNLTEAPKTIPAKVGVNTFQDKNNPEIVQVTAPSSIGKSTGEAASFIQTSYKLTPVLDPYASEIDLKETVDGWFVPTMPDLNHRNPHVMKYLIQNSIWWIETVGIDGIRMDTYPYADANGMSLWMKTLDEEYPNFNVVGETWVTEPPYTAAWQKDSRLNANGNSYLKTVMDFSFFDKLARAKTEATDGWFDGYNRLYNNFVYDYLYEDPTHVMAFVDNHDTDRFLGNTKDAARLKQALALLLTVRRIPQLYYGTEILMNGTKEITDGNVRQDFPGGFAGDKRNAFTSSGRTAEEQDMWEWLSRLLHWRQGNETIIRGYMTQFTPWKGVYVVARRWHRNTVITVINGTDAPATLEVARIAELLDIQGTATSTNAVDVPTGRRYDLSKDVELSAREGLVLELE